VQHGDVEQLAASLQTLLADPSLAREMGARGRERVEREFHFETFANSLKHILGNLCESRTLAHTRRISHGKSSNHTVEQ
jgi:glycosyltransferase involved in cell wall biosynthesis